MQLCSFLQHAINENDIAIMFLYLAHIIRKVEMLKVFQIYHSGVQLAVEVSTYLVFVCKALMEKTL